MIKMSQHEQIGQHDQNDQNDQNELAKDKMSQHESTLTNLSR
jgi:hypothetical protein